MRVIETELPSSGYGSQQPRLTGYVQDTVESQAGRLRPAVIVVPGGGYTRCSDREAEPIALAFVAAGCQAFVLNYTVLDERERQPLLPQPQLDLAHAVMTVRAQAQACAVDTERIAVIGFSAGGHVCATYTGLMADEAFAQVAGATCADLAVRAQLLCYPAIDLAAGWPPDPARVASLCGGNDRLLRAQDLVGVQTPRTFIWHTAEDGTVPVANSYCYAAALARAGVDHECHVFHRGRHGLALATKQTGHNKEHRNAHVAHWFDLALEWLDEA